MALHKQAVSLAILQAAEVIQPLLVLPYAGTVLGTVAFGHYAYALALVQFGSLLVEYGFYFTARRAAAELRHDPAALRRLLAEVTAAKGVLCLVLTVIGLPILSVIPSITAPMLLCVMIAGIGAMLDPTWMFIAVERAWESTVCVVVARCLALIAFLAVVTSPSQAYFAAGIQAAIPLVSALVSLPFMLAIGLGGFRYVTVRSVIAQLRQGWRSFLSVMAYMAIIPLQVPLVQHFAGFAAAGQYAVAEKLIGAVRPVFRVIAQTLMPRAAYLAANDPEKGLALVRTSLLTLVMGGAMSLALILVGPTILTVLFGVEFSGSVSVVHILCVAPILMNISLCMADIYMFHFADERAWAALMVSGLPVFLAVSFIASYWTDGALAVAFGFVAGEGVIALIATGYFVASALARKRLASLRSAEK
jgi:O-antigen/teichoic acid export membrane protein